MKNQLKLRRWNNMWGDQCIIQVIYIDDKGEHIRGSFTLFEHELDLLDSFPINSIPLSDTLGEEKSET